MTFRNATPADAALLADLNRQLIQDEGHRNRMNLAELEARMSHWLAGEYRAILFENGGEVVAYALYKEQKDEIYLRQFFVVRHRRKQGLGRQAIEILRAKFWPSDKRLTLEVLVANTTAIAFWRAIGFSDYCLTMEMRPS